MSDGMAARPVRELDAGTAKALHGGWAVRDIPSAVTRLVYNCVESRGCSSVAVEVEWTSFTVSVLDNGCGMDFGTLSRIGREHVTSRPGGAGSSMTHLAAVSVLQVESRARASNEVYETAVSCGRVLLPCAAASRPTFSHPGTRVVARNLFFNLPVRRRGVSARREQAACAAFLRRLAVAYPAVSFSLFNKDQSSYVVRFPAARTREKAWSACFGDSTPMVPVPHTVRAGMTVEGLVGVGPSPGTSLVCVNGRLVTCAPILKRASRFLRGWRGYLPLAGTARNKQESDDACAMSCFLAFSASPDAFSLIPDVSPPTVLFTAEEQATDLVVQSLSLVTGRSSSKGARHRDSGPASRARSPAASGMRRRVRPRTGSADVTTTPTHALPAHAIPRASGTPRKSPSSHFLASQPQAMRRTQLASVRVIRQVDCKFIMCVQGGRIVCVDQHAADERVRLESLQRRVLKGFSDPTAATSPVTPVTLDPPETLIVGGDVAHSLHQLTPLLARWLCRAERLPGQPSGRGTTTPLLLRQVPRIFGVRLSTADVVEYLTAVVAIVGAEARQRFRPPALDRVLASRACRHAIMFGDQLTMAQCRKLLRQLSKCDFPFICAHGRPTMVPVVDFSMWQAQRRTLDPSNADTGSRAELETDDAQASGASLTGTPLRSTTEPPRGGGGPSWQRGPRHTGGAPADVARAVLSAARSGSRPHRQARPLPPRRGGV